MQLNQKETTLLKDLTDQERLCADKYSRYSATATDPQLKNLFSQIATVEQGHYNALSQLSGGTVPEPEASRPAMPSFKANYGASPSPEKQNDCFLCTDMLTAEKHVSSLYDTCIFEFRDEEVRKLLNKIQSDEQCHGKMIYDYMEKNAMYS